MADNSLSNLPKGVQADLVLQRLRSDKSLETLQLEALQRLKENVSNHFPRQNHRRRQFSWQPLFPLIN
jgi:hypothetical protein